MLLDATLNAQAAAVLAGKPGLHIGPFLLGFFVDSILLGIVIMLFIHWQTWNAYRESIAVRLLVYYLMLFAATYCVFMITFNMRIFALYYGEWGIWLDTKFTRWVYIFDTGARTPVSAFFAVRAYKLGGQNKIFAVIISVVLMASFGGAIWTRIKHEHLYDSIKNLTPMIFLVATEVGGDLIISGYITFWLIKSRTGWKTTDKTITKLVVLIAETQLPPTIGAFVFLMVVLQRDLTTVVGFFVFMPNLYIMSCLMLLNKRFALRRERDHETSTWKQRTKEMYARRNKGPAPTGNIQVTTETVRHVDDGRATFENDKDHDKGSISAEGGVEVLNFGSSKTRLTKPEA